LELRLVFGACADDWTVAGVRDAALLAVLYGAGLRSSEAVALDLPDYASASNTLQVRRGSQPVRIAHLAPGGRAALEAWCVERGNRPGALFWPIRRDHTLCPGRLPAQAVRAIVQRRGHEAGLGSLSPRDLYRTYWGDLEDAGLDPRTIELLARGASYGARLTDAPSDEAALRHAIGRLHVPYRPRMGDATQERRDTTRGAPSIPGRRGPPGGVDGEGEASTGGSMGLTA
jgi:integrase